MNSDNSAIGGVTLDYGPFAFMERFNPLYNPWVGGGRPYCFGQQPQVRFERMPRRPPQPATTGSQAQLSSAHPAMRSAPA